MLEDAVVQHRARSGIRITPEHYGRIPGHFVHAHDHAGQEQVALDVVQVLETELLPDRLKTTHAIQVLNSFEGTRLDNIRSHALRDTRIEGLKHEGVGGVQIHLAFSFLRKDGHHLRERLDDLGRDPFDQP